MATYKRIIDVETVAEVTENMNVLVEDTGTLKKVPANKIGGSNGVEFTYIHEDPAMESGYAFGRQSEDGEMVTAINLAEAMQNGIVFIDYSNEESPDYIPSRSEMLIGYQYYYGDYIFITGLDSRHINLLANYNGPK